MLIVGLTGSFGTGKSTVAQFFKELGAKVLDADKINHRLLQKNGKCFKAVTHHFGKDILTKGEIDRRKLAAIVFNNSRKLKKLCRIVHPAVVGEIKKEILRLKKTNNRTILIIDAPLLIEAGLHRLADILIVVTASPARQLQRIQRRMTINKKEVSKRIEAQMALKDKVKIADIIIDNTRALTQTKREVKRVWQDLLKKNRKK